jgi:type I restriction enzyme M protein
MPENLFYNTTAPGIVLVINKAKRHKGQVLLVNASKECAKGKPKNYLKEENIARIADAYLNWREIEKLSKLIKVEEAARNDFNLSPSRYVAVDGVEEVLPVEEAVVLLAEAEEERQDADGRLSEMLIKLGLSTKIEPSMKN